MLAKPSQALPLRKHPGSRGRRGLLGKVLRPGGGNEALTKGPVQRKATGLGGAQRARREDRLAEASPE